MIDIARIAASSFWIAYWITWVPGLALALLASAVLVRDYLRVDTTEREDMGDEGPADDAPPAVRKRKPNQAWLDRKERLRER